MGRDAHLTRISAVFRALGAITFLATVASPLHGCSPGASTSVKTPTNGTEKPRVAALPRIVVTSKEALSVNELFERGMRRFSDREYVLAAGDLETAARAAPEQPWAPIAYYTAGIARDESGGFRECEEDFRRAVHSQTLVPQQRDAHIRLIRVLVYFERWKEAASEADALVNRYKDLRTLESITVRGAKALAEILEGDLEHAERDVEIARTIIEEQQFDLPVKIHVDVAVVYYALGEIRRKRAEAIRFIPPPEDFPVRLERRCQLLLDAQSAYSTTMRAYDANWSFMAGYRVGILYAQLHADLMDMLPAMSFESPERAQLFEAALRLRYSVLLEKAIGMLDHALSLTDRTRQDDEWVRLARDTHAELKGSLAEEQAALLKVPYSREELKLALEKLRKGKRIVPAPAQRQK